VPEVTAPFDFALCVCSTFKGADSEEEVLVVARMICAVIRMPEPLPSLFETHKPAFCSKTMVSLALFYDYMVKRTERRGAPSPAYYREVAKTKLRGCGCAAVADHHEQWERFLGENLL